jgi:2-hydroxychromene-2-carboxylate isomerase
VQLADVGPFRCAEEIAAYQEDVERAARRQGVQKMVWPEPFPAESDWAMLVATYAKQIGRAVAFSLAAFRQAFAAGRDLSERDNVLLAAAACEMHPLAVIKGAELRGTRERLEAANAEACAAGVRETPAVVTAAGEVIEVPA